MEGGGGGGVGGIALKETYGPFEEHRDAGECFLREAYIHICMQSGAFDLQVEGGSRFSISSSFKF